MGDSEYIMGDSEYIKPHELIDELNSLPTPEEQRALNESVAIIRKGIADGTIQVRRYVGPGLGGDDENQ
jgi:hypothetical protein